MTHVIGYSKGLMFFNMIRRQLGDETFIRALRRFYDDNRFQFASFTDMQNAFEAAGGRSMATFFRQWIERPGAPQLVVKDIKAVAVAQGYRLQGRLEQKQNGPAYSLQVPLAVQLNGRSTALETIVAMQDKQTQFDVNLPAQPVRLVVDPRYDLFRLLDEKEIPPSLGKAFAGQETLFVLPAEAPQELLEGYRALLQTWMAQPQQVVLDRDLKTFPDDRPVWLLGWENRFRDKLGGLLRPQVIKLSSKSVQLKNRTLSSARYSIVLVARAADRRVIAWLATENPQALPGLARKLPHYSRYSYLAFQGDAPDNTLKGQWPVTDSPLNAALSGPQTPPIQLKPRPPLSDILSK
jgi:hypothetical protein